MSLVLNSTSVMERARRYLSRCPPAISGQGGHKTTFRVTCVLVHGFALTASEALAVLLEWNATCQPPWLQSELEHKITSAMATPSRRPLGYLLGVKAKSPGIHLVAPGGAPALPVFNPSKPVKAVFLPATLERVA